MSSIMFKLEDINYAYTKLTRYIKNSITSEFMTILMESLTAYEENYQFEIAFRQGRWDGKKRFYTIESENSITIPRGLVVIIIKDLIERGFKPNIDFTYTNISKHLLLKENQLSNFIKSLNLKYTPYKYQYEAVEKMISRKRGIFRSATSSGKSLMIYITIRFLLTLNKNIVLIVPSISLVNQMYNDFIDYGWNINEIEKNIKLIGGEHLNKKGFNKDLSEKPVVISTWQSLYQLKSKEFDCLDCVIVDEVHTAKQGKLEELIYKIKNAEWRIGVTGTVPYTKIHKLSLQGSLGKIYHVIKARELIDLKLATPVIINAIYINYPIQDKLYKKIDYNSEVKLIETHKKRNILSAKILDKISEKGNTLGLFSRFEQGSAILEEIINNRLGKKIPFLMLYNITHKSIQNAFNYWKNNKKNIRIYLNSDITSKDRDNIKYFAEYIPNDDIDKFIDCIIFTDDKSNINLPSITTKNIINAYNLFRQGNLIYFDINKLKYYTNDIYSLEDFNNNKLKFLSLIKQDNKKRIRLYANKISNREANDFIQHVYSLKELNIYFYNGQVNPTLREKIRQELETIDNNQFELDFGSFKCFINGDTEYKLTNGSFIRGSDITTDTDLEIIDNNVVSK